MLRIEADDSFCFYFSDASLSYELFQPRCSFDTSYSTLLSTYCKVTFSFVSQHDQIKCKHDVRDGINGEYDKLITILILISYFLLIFNKCLRKAR